MVLAFRLECPHCHWGQPWSNRYVNVGWLRLDCDHCDRQFWTKIDIPQIKVDTRLLPPPDTAGVTA